MSTSIDKRIVEMELRNQEFEKNAEKTKRTLEELEKSLDFDSDVSKSLDVISSKFTNMGLVGQRVLSNLTDSVMDFGKNIVKSVTLDGLTEGFSQYESVMTSTKVLMNATGQDLATVTKYLDEMQRYAEDTVYDFAFMAENVTKMVNTGLDLGKAVTAMEGLGNAMAFSGVEGFAANTVIFNTTQAISAGYMALKDWRSIMDQGMNTQKFQQQLIDTAVAMGTLVKVGDKYKSVTKDGNNNTSDLFDSLNGFTDSLAHRWLTSDVLIETMASYNDETTELGQSALDAARSVTKFSKMMDSLKESRSGGWATSMKLIFGDLNEATELWTGIYKRLDAWLTAIYTKRNDILKAWNVFGGRNESIEAFHNTLDIIEKINGAISKGISVLFQYNKGWRFMEDLPDTVDIGPVGNAIYETMVKISRGINSFTKSLIPSETTLRNISEATTGLFTIIRAVIDMVSPIIVIVAKVIKIFTPLFKIVIAIAGAIGNMTYQIANVIRSALNLGPAFTSVTDFLDSMYETVNNFSDKVVDKIYQLVAKFAIFLLKLRSGLIKLPDIKSLFTGIAEGFTNAINNFKEKKTIGSFFEGFFGTESLKIAAEGISNWFSEILGNAKDFVNNLKETIRGIGPVGELIVSIFDLAVNVIDSFVDSIKNLLAPITGTIGNTTNKLVEFLSNMELGDAIKNARIIAFIITLNKLRKSLKSISDIANSITNFFGSLNSGIMKFADAAGEVGKGIKFNLQAEGFKNIAYGLGVIVASIIALASIDQVALNNAVSQFVKIVTIIGALIFVFKTLGTKEKQVKGLSDQLSTTATALTSAASSLLRSFGNALVLGGFSLVIASLSAFLMAISVAITNLGNLDFKTYQRGLAVIEEIFTQTAKLIGAIGGVIAVLTLIDKIPTKGSTGSTLLKIAGSMALLAAGLTALAVPFVILSAIKLENVGKGLLLIAGVIGVVLTAVGVLGLFSESFPDIHKSMMAIAVTLFGFSAALSSMILPIFALGSMNPDTVSRGLKALGVTVLYLSGTLISLGIAMRIMGDNIGSLWKLSLGFGLLMASITGLALIAPIIVNNAHGIEKAISSLVKIIVEAIVDSADTLVRGTVELVIDVLSRLRGSLPIILIELETIITQVLDWLISYIPSLNDKIGQIIVLLNTGIARAIKENMSLDDFLLTFTTITAIIILIKRFAKLKDDIMKALPAFVALTLVIGALALIITTLVKNEVNSTDSIGAAIALSILLKVLVNVAKQIPDIIKPFEEVKFGQLFKALATFAIIFIPIAMLFTTLKKFKIDSQTMIGYSAGLSLALLALSPMLAAMGQLNKNSGGIKFGTLMSVVLEISLISAALAAVLAGLTKFDLDPVKMVKYSAALSVAFVGISPMILSLAVLQKYASQAPKMGHVIGVMVEVVSIAGILVGTFALFNALPIDPMTVARYASALSIAFIGISPMILSLAVVKKACAGMQQQSLKPMIGILILAGGIALTMAAAFSIMTVSKVDPNSIMKYAESMSLAMLAIVPFVLSMGVMTGIFAKLGVTGDAMISAGFGIIGVVTIAFVIFSMLATLIGALDYLADGQVLVAIQNSVPIFQSLGEAIGALIGGLLGGLAGASLSSFTNLAQPFFDAISALPDDFAAKMTALGAGFLALSAAGFINAIGDLLTFFSGDASLVKFGEDLAAFGPQLKTFVEAFPDIDVGKAESIKLVSESLKSLVDAMPKEGGVVQWFTGTVKMEEFTKNIGALGRGMQTFDIYTRNLNSDSVTHAVNCGKMMAELANYLPKTGGIVQFWGGEVNMEGFSKNLPLLGKAIVEFNDAVTKDGSAVVNEDSVSTAVNAGEMIAGLWDKLPETGGKFQDWFGEKDLSKFAKNIPKLGEGIADFNDAVTGENGSKINAESVQIAVWVGEAVAGIYNNLPSGALFKKLPDLGDFATNVGLLGQGIGDFSDNTVGINIFDVNAAVDALGSLAGMQNALTGGGSAWFWDVIADSNRMKNFADNIPRFGKGIKGLSDNMQGADINRIQTATDALNALTNMTELANDLGGVSIDAFQKAIEHIDVNSFSSAAEAVTSDASLKNIGQKFKDIGKGYIQNLYIGLKGDDAESKRVKTESVVSMIDSLVDTMKPYAKGEGYEVGKYIGLGLWDGLWDRSVLERLTERSYALVDGVINQMKVAADEHSPSKRTMQIGRYLDEGLALGIENYSNLAMKPAYALSDEAIAVMNDGMTKVYQLIASGADIEPTISPVIDLTNARRSVGELNTLFSSVSNSPDFGFDNNYSLDLTKNIKMEAESTVKPADLTKITDGIAKVGQKLSDMEKTIADMQIYLDTGALVGGMTTPLMNSINRQNRSINRGVIPSRVK